MHHNHMGFTFGVTLRAVAHVAETASYPVLPADRKRIRRWLGRPAWRWRLDVWKKIREQRSFEAKIATSPMQRSDFQKGVAH